jgi:hypothetical protein
MALSSANRCIDRLKAVVSTSRESVVIVANPLFCFVSEILEGGTRRQVEAGAASAVASVASFARSLAGSGFDFRKALRVL